MLVQALLKVLYDRTHQLAYTTPAQKPQMPYSDIGLPRTDMHMLRILFLSLIQAASPVNLSASHLELRLCLCAQIG